MAKPKLSEVIRKTVTGTYDHENKQFEVNDITIDLETLLEIFDGKFCSLTISETKDIE